MTNKSFIFIKINRNKAQYLKQILRKFNKMLYIINQQKILNQRDTKQHLRRIINKKICIIKFQNKVDNNNNIKKIKKAAIQSKVEKISLINMNKNMQIKPH